MNKSKKRNEKKAQIFLSEKLQVDIFSFISEIKNGKIICDY